jgi:hypothetical protein
MRKDHDVLRALIRETLKSLSPADVELSKSAIRTDVHSSGLGQTVRVELNGKTWLTRSQAEIDHVLKRGGKIVKGG